MLDTLRILFCGVGAVYLGLRLISLLHALAGRHCLLPSVYKPLQDKSHTAETLTLQRHDAVTPVVERTTASSS